MNQYLIIIHIIAGSVAVIGMLTAWLMKKGSQSHRLGGKIYSMSMALALVVAIILSILTKNLFLGLIALFTAYLIYSGWRYAKVKDGSVTVFDFGAIYLMLGVSVAMFVYGGYLLMSPLTGSGEGLGPVMIAFGAIGGIPAWEDLRFGYEKPQGKERIIKHIARMGGASIATTTAIFVVNVELSPAFILWLLPTVVITPLIIFHTRKVRRQ